MQTDMAKNIGGTYALTITTGGEPLLFLSPKHGEQPPHYQSLSINCSAAVQKSKANNRFTLVLRGIIRSKAKQGKG
jgi:hypothetical protein